MSSDPDEALSQEWYDRKTALMVDALGQEHDMVMHTIIPYALGGGLDLYYFPHGIPGTAIATKELSEVPNEGSSNSVYRSYELVMFTRHPISLDEAKDDTTDFGRAHRNINAILNCIARYSAEAQLNPNETCEFPQDMETLGGKCLIFDAYGRTFDDEAVEDFGLMAIIEIFRSEMEFAMAEGGALLLEKLKLHGHYPYSDLDRDPVV
jgi:hypothetical protein